MDWIAFGLFLIWIALLCINGNLMRLTTAVREVRDAGSPRSPIPDPLSTSPYPPPPKYSWPKK